MSGSHCQAQQEQKAAADAAKTGWVICNVKA